MARFSAPPPSARPARPPCRPRSAGASPIAHRVAARHADVYLTRGEPPDQVAQQIATVRRLAEAQGRTVRFGIRLHLVVRETTARARDAANDLIRYVDEDAIARAQVTLGSTQAVGQQRMIALHGGRRDALEVSPNLWAGVGLVRGGAGTALVGDADTVAARMEEYAALGTAELLFPRLPREFFRQGEDWPARSFTPSGEFAPERLALVRR